MKNNLKKAEKKFEQQSHEQLKMIYPAVVLSLWELGWRHRRITRRMDEAENVWMECASGDRSLLEIMEDETGIEMRLPETNTSYKDIWWLNSELRPRRCTNAQTMLIRQQQFKWMPTMILSTICLSLYRVDGWSVVRLSRLIQSVYDKYTTLGKEVADKMEQETDFTLSDITDKYIRTTYPRNGG